MTPEEHSKVPTAEELAERYKHLEHPGLERISNWGMPNSAEDTVDQDVERFMSDDDSDFFKKIDSIFD